MEKFIIGYLLFLVGMCLFIFFTRVLLKWKRMGFFDQLVKNGLYGIFFFVVFIFIAFVLALIMCP